MPLVSTSATRAFLRRRWLDSRRRLTPRLHVGELVRTTAFVLAVLYSAVFGLLTAGVFGLIYWSNTSFMDTQTEAKLRNETDALLRVYRERGLPALIDAVSTRSSMAGLLSHHYLLVDDRLRYAAGNLSAWPEGVPAESGSVEFSRAVQYPLTHTVDWDTDERYDVAAQVTRLDNGHRLLIGYSLYESAELREQSLSGLIVGSVVTIVLALVVGAALGRSMLSRVDAIDSALADIMAGDLGRRVEVTKRYDEFGQLAARINVMLDRVEELVTSLREVARNLSHDIRAPLYRVRGHLEQLSGAAPAPALRASARRGLDDVDHVVASLDDLLDVARSGGSQVSIFEAVDLSALTEAALTRLQVRQPGSVPAVQRDVAPGLLVRGIPHLLSQAVDVLLETAVADAGATGQVIVRLGRGSDGAVDLQVMGRRAAPGTGGGAEGRRGIAGLREVRAAPGSEAGLSAASAIAKLHGARLILERGSRGDRRICLRMTA